MMKTLEWVDGAPAVRDMTGDEIAELTAIREERAPVYAREKRDRLLRTVVDPIVTNPLRWAEMTDAQRQAWTDYRRALLDVPEQPGFPAAISWPTAPA